jgi:hypothetical protein
VVGARSLIRSGFPHLRSEPVVSRPTAVSLLSTTRLRRHSYPRAFMSPRRLKAQGAPARILEQLAGNRAVASRGLSMTCNLLGSDGDDVLVLLRLEGGGK